MRYDGLLRDAAEPNLTVFVEYENIPDWRMKLEVCRKVVWPHTEG